MWPNCCKPSEGFFATGQTRSLGFRLAQLKQLRGAVLKYQEDIVQAAVKDLGRPEFEGYVEVGIIGELDYIIKQLPKWVKPRKARLSLSQLPGAAWLQPEPLGSVLIIGPWNYPFQLIMSPLMGAMAAGNCAVLKPSELAPATSQVLAKLVQETFDPTYVALVEGGVETAQELLAEPFPTTFCFTGGGRVGKIVMQAGSRAPDPGYPGAGGQKPLYCPMPKTNVEGDG